MSASDALGRQFHVEHDYSKTDWGAVRGTARAYSGSGLAQRWLGTINYGPGVGDTLSVDNLRVEESARRQGVASRLYDEVYKTHQQPLLHVRDEQSPAGRKTAMAASRRNPEQHRWLGFDRNGNAVARKLRGT